MGKFLTFATVSFFFPFSHRLGTVHQEKALFMAWQSPSPALCNSIQHVLLLLRILTITIIIIILIVIINMKFLIKCMSWFSRADSADTSPYIYIHIHIHIQCMCWQCMPLVIRGVDRVVV